MYTEGDSVGRVLRPVRYQRTRTIALPARRCGSTATSRWWGRLALLAALVFVAACAEPNDSSRTASPDQGTTGDRSAALVGAPTAGAPNASAESAALADTLATLIADAYDFSDPDVLDRMIDLYASGEDVVSASDGQITMSADSVRAGIVRFWNEAGRNMRNARWTWGHMHVERLAPDAAVLTATWSIPHLAPDGQPHVIAGAWTAVFRRLDGEWKIVQEHLSAPPS